MICRLPAKMRRIPPARVFQMRSIKRTPYPPKSITTMASFTHSLLANHPNYIYPLVINVIAGIVPIWASGRVARGRRKVGLKYPAEYCPGPIDEVTDKDKFLFNCTQRAHQVRFPLESRLRRELTL